MTSSLTLWTGLGIVFGIGIIFILGFLLGVWMVRRAIQMYVDDAVHNGVLHYRDLRFIPVNKGETL